MEGCPSVRVQIRKKAEKQRQKLPKAILTQINKKIDTIEAAVTFDELHIIEGKLKGSTDHCKIRQGDYRIVLKRESETHVLITSIRHRKDIYDQLYSLLLSIT